MKKIERFTPDVIDTLQENEVFVFGSNMAGRHAGGAAAKAYNDFGAEWGVGEGITGDSYALPTLDENFNKLTESELTDSFVKMIRCAQAYPEKTFLVTKVGCGIAGYELNEIRSALWAAFEIMSDETGKDDSLLDNIILPKDFYYVYE